MVDSCCPGNTTAIPAVPTISMCPYGGNLLNGICLPSSCWSRTWRLVTCRENCQPSGSAPGGCEPTPCQPPCLPATSRVAFACQPMCSCIACYESSTGGSPCLVSSCQPSCSESTRGEEKGCEASPSQQSSCQEPVFVSGPHEAACGPSACSHSRCCHPSFSEVTSCPEMSCPPTGYVARPCQPTCCQAVSCHPISGEDQPCKSAYYQPICCIFKTCQAVPCTPVPCQPSTCVSSSCSPTCCVTSSYQPLNCQPALPTSFLRQPVANCSPYSVKRSCKPASCGTTFSGQPTCGGLTSCNQSGYKSLSCQPACCVTGLGKSSGGDSNGF